MKLNLQTPEISGSERAEAAKAYRERTAQVAAKRAHALTCSNGEEHDHAPQKKGGPAFPANFTKGLAHNLDGMLSYPTDYQCFVEAINSSDTTLFDKHVETAATRKKDPFHCKIRGAGKPDWRGWESPRAGHAFELEGPDSGAVGMAPAPRVGSSELAAEMAEVYALALLRDVPFTTIDAGGQQRIDGSSAEISANDVVAALNTMPYFSGIDAVSSTPNHSSSSAGLNGWERRRRRARGRGDLFSPLEAQTIFRGSTVGALEGPHVSQFLLAGSGSRAGSGGGTPSYPGVGSEFGASDGYIVYGNQIIDQRVVVAQEGLDYMTSWSEWLDVQNGADLKDLDKFEPTRRFITTPRDLATYVHFDSLYQAYLNACLLLLGAKTPASAGFPEPSFSGHRDAFATFGDPHILSLVTEVATRCLKAVRRQKFNYHRRARPETLSGRLALLSAKSRTHAIGAGTDQFRHMLQDIPEVLRDAVIEHNRKQNTRTMRAQRNVMCSSQTYPTRCKAAEFARNNLLLPMAFPEGSPMHPAYGAGHATVAAGCVTMLKAFFEMFDPSEADGLRKLKFSDADYYTPAADGSALVGHNDGKLSVQGELDKLAANISIGRNMAGVHYYSDYYDSLRMGERIATGILMEQLPAFSDHIETSFDSFDGDRITLASNGPKSDATISIQTSNGDIDNPGDWWLRHVCGRSPEADR